MSYKTLSRNMQRYSVLKKNMNSSIHPRISSNYSVDFSHTIGDTISFLKGILYVCKKCGLSNQVENNEIISNFHLETKNHVLYSTFKKAKCKKCKNSENSVYFLRLKNKDYDKLLAGSQLNRIKDIQNGEILSKLKKGALYVENSKTVLKKK